MIPSTNPLHLELEDVPAARGARAPGPLHLAARRVLDVAGRGLRARGEGVRDAVARRGHRLRCVVHGDPYITNTFVTRAGEPELWASSARMMGP